MRRALPAVLVAALSACGPSAAAIGVSAAPEPAPPPPAAIATAPPAAIATAAPVTSPPPPVTPAPPSASATTAPAPGPASAPAPAPAGFTGGDPGRFCRAVGPYLTSQVLLVFATPAGPDAAVAEVVFSPATAALADELAASAPAALAPRFQAVAARARGAEGALRAAGATEGDLNALRAALLARTTSQVAAVAGGNPADPTAYGLDRARVRDAAAAFVAARGDAASFRAAVDALGPEPPDPATVARLAATWPCLADLLTGGDADHDVGGSA